MLSDGRGCNVALFEDYGKAENDQGERFVYAKDGDKEIAFYVRRIPLDVYRKLNKRYGKEETTVEDGFKRVVMLRNEDEWMNFLTDQACFALVSAENLVVNVKDQESAKEWSRLLSKTVEIGELVLDGPLSDGAKKRLILIAPRLGTWLVQRAVEVQKKNQAVEEELTGN